MKRLILCICIFLSLIPIDLWGQSKTGLQPSKLETEVLYDVEGIAYKQVWRKDGKVVRCCYLTRSGQEIENATWSMDVHWVSTLADKVLDKIRFDYANCTNVRGIVLLLAVPELNIAELRLTDVLPAKYKTMLLKAVREVESDITGLEGDAPILAHFPVRFTTN
ncbi:hypothetical protein [Hoylesella loescheii]|uniref:Uncharacterized protein n=1 Tax=Hoylesella loescheii DSM 19665 = JCM 12249 = ATCC 15930 TaxID=1122985 RepID=A0A069QH07_HOYLO|nr:hypothetical protein [Hoylesella loescheii]KDR51972.1 hypothetical protein HMPREF1991_01939 [Hoylesella loescheii DSM 19665 = JCM 12249 = ATCC 15930]